MRHDEPLTPAHRELRELLGAFALGQLDPAEATRVRAHLDGCDRCRGELADLVPVAAALRDVDPERAAGSAATPPAALGERIAALVREQPVEARRPVRHRRTWPGVAAGLGAAAAVAAVFALGAVTGLPGDGDPGDPGAPVTGAPVEDLLVEPAVAGVLGDAGLVTHTWGTEVRLEVAGLVEGGTYRVVVTREDGTAVDAGTFIGTGAATVRCSLNAALPRAEAALVRVTDAAGQEVLRAEAGS